MRQRSVLLAFRDGPLAGSVAKVEGWPWTTPKTVVWITRDASRRCVELCPDEDLVSMVAKRASDGGLGWIPYRRAVAEPQALRRGLIWHYRWVQSDA